MNLINLSIELVERLIKYCYDEEQYEQLQMIIKREKNKSEYLAKNYNIVDFLTAYDSINLSFLEFYEVMPKITPRFYTVASSPNYIKNKIEIIISLLEWKGLANQVRYGLTSNYYKMIYDKNTLDIKTRLIIRESSFRIPKDPSQSMIMICTGTGVAPYISFLQEFEYIYNNRNSAELNHSCLIFGSKNRNYDFIYEDQINSYLNKNILNKLHTAFSRDQDKKVYVQDIIKENKTEFENLIKSQSIVYICGGVSMGAEVTQVLESILSRDIVKDMEMNGRLIKELWG